MDDEAVKDQWESFLEAALQNFRHRFPADARSDREVMHSLMDYFAKAGVVKVKDGKYVVGRMQGNMDAMLAALKGPSVG